MIISKEYLYIIVIFQDLDSKIPRIELVPLLRQFSEVFPNDHFKNFLVFEKWNFVLTC